MGGGEGRGGGVKSLLHILISLEHFNIPTYTTFDQNQLALSTPPTRIKKCFANSVNPD